MSIWQRGRGLLAATTIALTTALWPATTTAGNIGAAVSMLPPEVDFVAGFEVDALQNSSSIYSRIPKEMWDEVVSKDAPQQRAKLGKPLNDINDLLMTAYILEDLNVRFHTFAGGMKLDEENEAENIVIVMIGDFTTADSMAFLKNFNPTAGPGKTGKLEGPADGPVFVAVPMDGVMVASTSADWADGALKRLQDKSGIMAQGTEFSRATATLGGRRPEIIAYLSERLVTAMRDKLGDGAASLGPAAMILGQLKTMTVASFAGDNPTIEIHAGMIDEQGPAQLTNMARGMLQGYLPQMQQGLAALEGMTPRDEDSINGAKAAIMAMQSITVQPSGSTFLLTLALRNMLDSEEVAAMMNKSLQESFERAKSLQDLQSGGSQ